jgi:hypothetical protein
VGGSHIIPPHPETVAFVLNLAGKRAYRPERIVWVAGGGGGVPGDAVAGVALADELKVVLPQSDSPNTGWLDPVGRHGDGLTAHKELQCFPSPRMDLVGAAVRGLQSPACCVLTEKDMRAVMEVLVHECGWGGVARCRNWSEAGRMLTSLCYEVLWFYWVGCRGQ